ncbi:signal peptide peptidase [Legionella sainthelensi]|uniref:S49 family peptidase n=1 Tax=Legionella sainthelensi TaxID=28087 RepID=A0A0W0YSK0_9GAMM|nr:S49 family peptidase [Legionella sainthelensi]AUH73523.1 S49 family peptidase [Legionella sainthelensi]KTD59840.1 signal peptide peptidase [Legionella sainthelensi]VEB37072.1 signal peptide peptidase [Legionella sainthelensi]VEH31269.1 signal peptide peptidase [Legionella sainthelensi]
MTNDISSNSSQDSQALLNQIIIDYMKEAKRKRRWKWFMRVIYLLIIAYIVYQFSASSNEEVGTNTKPHVGIVDINGEMADAKPANSDDFAKGLDTAYKNSGLKALIVRINSPGGSPVQAEYMYNTIKYYQKKHPDIKIYSVCVDACASAAYYVAVATDAIYASPASMVGSIGVLYNGFGVVDLMSKIGVSRRLQTSGVNKGFLDPFSPQTDFEKQKLQTMLDIVHQQFINRVKEGRGSRLHIDDETFSGLFWTGEQALTMGLIDGYASSGQLAREIINVPEVIDYTHKQNLFDRVTKNIGTAMADELPLSFGARQGFK